MAFRVKTMEQLKKKYPTATFIKNWDELREWAKEHGESNSHKLIIEDHNGWIKYKGKDKYNPKKVWSRNIPVTSHYLSTHTFYGKGSYINSTWILQKCGFNVILDNWDAKEEAK